MAKIISVAGQHQFCFFCAILWPCGLLHRRQIQIHANKLPKENRNEFFYYPPIHYKDPTTLITMDAADVGWGATINGLQLSGLWSQMLAQQPKITMDNRWSPEYSRSRPHSCVPREGGTKTRRLLQTTFKIFQLGKKHRRSNTSHSALSARTIQPGCRQPIQEQ